MHTNIGMIDRSHIVNHQSIVKTRYCPTSYSPNRCTKINSRERESDNVYTNLQEK